MTQALPRSDNFFDGTAPNDLPSSNSVFHGNWLRVVPWLSTQELKASTATYYVDCGLGTLHDGYNSGERDPAFTSGPFVVSAGVAPGAAVFYGEDLAGSPALDHLYCAAFRQSYIDNGDPNKHYLNCRATAEFQNHDYSAVAPANDSIRFAVLFARYRQATVEDFTAFQTFTGANLDEAATMGQEHLADGDCYMAMFAQNSGANRRHWIFLRVNSGQATVLTSFAVTQSATTYWANPREITFQVLGSGASVELTLTVRGNAQVISQNGTPTQTVYQYTDNAVDRLVLPGRWGVGSSCPRNGQVVRINYWQLQNLDTPAPASLVREEWFRGPENAKLIAYKTVADDNGVQGRNLHCRYFGDAYSVRGNGAISANRQLIKSLTPINGTIRASANYGPRIDLLPGNSGVFDRRTIFAALQLASSGDTGDVAITHRHDFQPGYTATQNQSANDFSIIFRATRNASGTNDYQLIFVGKNALFQFQFSALKSWSGNQKLGTSASGTVFVTLDFETYEGQSANQMVFVVRVNGNTVGAGSDNGFDSYTNVTAQSGAFLVSGLTAAQQVGWHSSFSSSGPSSSGAAQWTILQSGGGQSLRIASQVLSIVTRTSTQMRVASQLLSIVTRTSTQMRVASQVLSIVTRSAGVSRTVTLDGPSFTFAAGSLSLSSSSSYTLSGPRVDWSPGVLEYETVYKPPTVEGHPAGEIVSCGTSTAVISVCGVSAGEVQL